jgi:hypothetical protein
MLTRSSSTSVRHTVIRVRNEGFRCPVGMRISAVLLHRWRSIMIQIVPHHVHAVHTFGEEVRQTDI